MNSVSVLFLVFSLGTCVGSQKRRLFDSGFHEEICATIYCTPGEQCETTPNGGRCVCASSCSGEKDKDLCGSDGVIYDNECELYRNACQRKIKIEQLDFQQCTSFKAPDFVLPKPFEPISSQEDGKCLMHDVRALAENLLMYFHAKYGEDTKGRPSFDNRQLVELLFKTLDQNVDGLLSIDDLRTVSDSARFSELEPANCHVSDLISLADNPQSKTISKKAFYDVYGLEPPPQPSTSPQPQPITDDSDAVIKHEVKRGSQYQILCRHGGGPNTLWYRYATPLTSVAPYDIEVTSSGELYIIHADFVHSGNYSCKTAYNPRRQQVHVVIVKGDTTINVLPKKTAKLTGQNAELLCDVQPTTEVKKFSWYKDGVKLQEHGRILPLPSVGLSNAGGYSCSVDVGLDFLSSAPSAVLVHESSTLAGVDTPPMHLVVLHNRGVNIYDGEDCKLIHLIDASYPLPRSQGSYMCRDSCKWTSAVMTQPANHLYAAVSDQNAIAVVDVSRGEVDEHVYLDHRAVKLHYVPWEDTVWIETESETSGQHYVQVIRKATHGMKHKVTHALPNRDEYEKIKDLFIPIEKALYGYFTRKGQRSIQRVDLHGLRNVASIDLSKHDCYPTNVTFIHHLGLLLISCKNTGVLVLDYLSDYVLHDYPHIHGEPVYSAEAAPSLIFYVDHELGRITSYRVSSAGLDELQSVEIFPRFLEVESVQIGVSDTKAAAAVVFTLNRDGRNTALWAYEFTDSHVKKVESYKTSGYPLQSASRSLAASPAPHHSLVVATRDALTIIDTVHMSDFCSVKVPDIDALLWAM